MKVVKGGTVSRLLKDVPVRKCFMQGRPFPCEVIARRIFQQLFSGKWHSLSLRKKDQTGNEYCCYCRKPRNRNNGYYHKAVVDFVKSKKAHLLLLYRQWEVTEELRQRGRLRFWKASESQKKQWDVLSVLLWRLWSWAIPVWDAELL